MCSGSSGENSKMYALYAIMCHPVECKCIMYSCRDIDLLRARRSTTRLDILALNMLCYCKKLQVILALSVHVKNTHFEKRKGATNYTKDNVTFYLPRPFHFLSYQSNRLLR
jgi:hypothetical protein